LPPPAAGAGPGAELQETATEIAAAELRMSEKRT
jgi:hypothetical protein